MFSNNPAHLKHISSFSDPLFLKPLEGLSKPAPDLLIPYQLLYNLASVGVGIQWPRWTYPTIPVNPLIPGRPSQIRRPHVLHVHAAEIKHRNACAQEECSHSVALPLPAAMHFLFTYCQMQSPGLPFTSTALKMIHHHHTLALFSQSHLPSQCAL